MTALDKIVALGAGAVRAAVGRARARVVKLARRRHDSPHDLIAAARRELARAEPAVARAVEDAVVAAWLRAARGPARLAAPPQPVAGSLLPFDPVGDALREHESPVTRYPAVAAAVADLTQRKVLLPGDYEALQTDARGAAFTVARATSEGAAEAVRDAVAQVVTRGLPLRAFRKIVEPVLDGAGLSESQVEAVYRTQTGLAQAAGLRAVLGNEQVAAEFPYVAWHATHDGRTRPDHAAMERAGIGGGNVYRCDDPSLRRVWPPCSWNCRCVVVPVSLEDAADAGVPEAQEWLRTGEPPARPAWVGSVPVRLPKGWPGASGKRVEPAV